MKETLIGELRASNIMRSRKIERDICEARSCAAIVIELAKNDISIAFDVIEASGVKVGYNNVNE